MKKRLKLKHLLGIIMMSVSGMAMSQGVPCENEYGKDSIETVKNLSLFNQYFQLKKYGESYPYWKYLFENAPCVVKRITYNAPTILKDYLAQLQESNPDEFAARMDGIADTLFMAYEKRIYYWGEEGYVLGKWANDYASFRPNDRAKAMEMFEKSVKMEGFATDDKVPIYLIGLGVKMVERNEIEVDSLYTLYFQMMDIISHNLKKASSPKATKEWEFANTAVNQYMAPYLTCAKVQEYFQPKIKENPSDLELLKRASAILSSAKCEDADFFIKVAEMIYAIEPSSESALSIARAHYANKNVDKAISFYEKGVGGMKAGNDKSEVYLRMANIMYKQGKYAQAKNYATSAIDNDVNNGSAYLIIAQYYGNSASSCTADNLDGRSVFWAAVDKCVQAKSVAPSVSNEANQLIAVYVSKYPKKEDAFFKGFTQDEGSSYTVPCLGVSTTVRFKN